MTNFKIILAGATSNVDVLSIRFWHDGFLSADTMIKQAALLSPEFGQALHKIQSKISQVQVSDDFFRQAAQNDGDGIYVVKVLVGLAPWKLVEQWYKNHDRALRDVRIRSNPSRGDDVIDVFQAKIPWVFFNEDLYELSLMSGGVGFTIGGKHTENGRLASELLLQMRAIGQYRLVKWLPSGNPIPIRIAHPETDPECEARPLRYDVVPVDVHQEIISMVLRLPSKWWVNGGPDKIYHDLHSSFDSIPKEIVLRAAQLKNGDFIKILANHVSDARRQQLRSETYTDLMAMSYIDEGPACGVCAKLEMAFRKIFKI